MAEPAKAFLGTIPDYLHDFTWAILYLPTSEVDPFVKVPVLDTTILAGQAAVGLDKYSRLPTYSGNVARDLFVSYKIYMFCHDTFFRSLNGMVEILNGFYSFCTERIDGAMPPETIYGLCTSLMPPATIRGLAIHVNLRSKEIRYITRNPKRDEQVGPLRFVPSAVPDEGVIR